MFRRRVLALSWFQRGMSRSRSECGLLRLPKCCFPNIPQDMQPIQQPNVFPIAWCWQDSWCRRPQVQWQVSNWQWFVPSKRDMLLPHMGWTGSMNHIDQRHTLRRCACQRLAELGIDPRT